MRALCRKAERDDAPVPCERTPRNAFFVSEIPRGSAGARVFTLRDSRDVVLSRRGKWRRRHLLGGSIPRRETLRSLLAYHPINAALLWKEAAKALASCEREPRVLCVRHEELLEAPTSVIKGICEFLGLGWGEGMPRLEQRGSSRSRDGAQGFDRRRASAWRSASARERSDVALCQWVCRGEMTTLGYRPESATPSRLHLLLQVLSWPPRTLLGELMNLRRVGSPLAAFKARLGRA